MCEKAPSQRNNFKNFYLNEPSHEKKNKRKYNDSKK